MRKSINPYPENWAEIAHKVKADAGYCCIRCGTPHDPKTGNSLTVHHIDLNPANNAWWNLAALCQRCHLTIQAKVYIERIWMFEHSAWFKPYLAGYYASINNLPTDKQYVKDHIDYLIDLGSGRLPL